MLYADETTVLWASDTVDRGYRVIMQRDGNLIVYDDKSEPVWTSKTQFQGEYLMCRDDGSMAVFSWSGKAVWSANTTQRKQLVYFVDFKLSTY